MRATSAGGVPGIRPAFAWGVLCLASFTLQAAPEDMPGSTTPPFEWIETFATAGASLQIAQKSQLKASVDLGLTATGFGTTTGLELWIKRGDRYFSVPATLDRRGIVKVEPETIRLIGKPAGPIYIDPRERSWLQIREDISLRGVFLKGESLDVALLDPRSGTRAHARVVPFPITSGRKHRCQGTAEVIERDPLTYLIAFTGFEPRESVRIARESRESPWTETLTASDRGDLRFRLMAKRSRTVIKATGAGCEAVLDFHPGVLGP